MKCDFYFHLQKYTLFPDYQISKAAYFVKHYQIIKRYDCPQAWHFIDPPYIGSNMGHYSGMFNEQSLIELLELCTTLQGKFMLTMYPHEEIRQYAERNGRVIHKIDRPVTAGKTKSRRRQEEWMVCNYSI
jgi:DNA adenine methylase